MASFNSSERLQFTQANIKYGIEALRVRAEKFFLLANRKMQTRVFLNAFSKTIVHDF